MKRQFLLLLGLCLLPNLARAEVGSKPYWPHWRGPNENGLVDQGHPPLEWSESRNIKWKAEIPGAGHATPLVWADRIYVQTAIQTNRPAEGARQKGKVAPPYIFEFRVLALDRKDGTIVWEHWADRSPTIFRAERVFFRIPE